eukprot:5604843-Lingulodinium_polyedra.AAC.1
MWDLVAVRPSSRDSDGCTGGLRVPQKLRRKPPGVATIVSGSDAPRSAPQGSKRVCLRNPSSGKSALTRPRPWMP